MRHLKVFLVDDQTKLGCTSTAELLHQALRANLANR
jgi:hypothetical protein